MSKKEYILDVLNQVKNNWEGANKLIQRIMNNEFSEKKINEIYDYIKNEVSIIVKNKQINDLVSSKVFIQKLKEIENKEDNSFNLDDMLSKI